jgi:DNA-binding SARP family transcriptional activator
MRLDALQIDVQLLGPLRVAVDGVSIAEAQWRFTHPKLLLQALMLSPNRQLPRAEVADWLWPQLSEEAASNRLYHTVHVLRKVLASTGATFADSAVAVRAGVVFLSPSAIWHCDAQRFLGAVSAARAAGDDTAASHSQLVRADCFYRGTPDSALNIEAIAATRLEIERSAIWVRESLAVSATDEATLIACWQRVLALQPVNEAAHRALILFYVSSGRHEQAQTQYDACCLALQTVGLEPAALTRAALHAVDAAAAHNPCGTPHRWNHAPPQSMPPLHDREAELACLAHWLREDKTRWITITGQPCIGKTRLAHALIERCAQQFEHGALLLQLSDTAASGGLLAQLAQAAGSPLEDDAALLEALSGRQALLVLDRFEHLCSEAPLLLRLLERCPGLQLVVTSTQSVDCEAERVFELVANAVQPALDPSGRERQHESVAARVSWSLDLLDSAPRRALPRLSRLPADGWTYRQACAALGDEDALPALLALRRSHLIVPSCKPDDADTHERRFCVASLLTVHLQSSQLP